MTKQPFPSPRALGVSTVEIDRRFEGPSGIANGGYLAGRFGGKGPTRVVLKQAARVGKVLNVAVTHHGLSLLDGRTELLTTSPTGMPDPVALSGLSIDPDLLPDPEGFHRHPFPGCFVCGPNNPTGLGIVFKTVANGVAGKFTVPGTGLDQPEAHVYVAGALDCSSGWSVYSPGEAGVLGTFEFAVVRNPAPGERLTVIAERGETTGRKRYARSSVFSDAGSLIGAASATWIDIPAGLHPVLPDHTSGTKQKVRGGQTRGTS